MGHRPGGPKAGFSCRGGGELDAEAVDEAALAREVCMADLPPVDLLIRTGGDHRISNFVLWQLALC